MVRKAASSLRRLEEKADSIDFPPLLFRYFGLQFIDPYNNSNAMEVATVFEDFLGSNLLSLQVGNEPDLYAGHQKRPSNYSMQDYFDEFSSYMQALDASAAPNKKMVLGPRSVVIDSVFLSDGYLPRKLLLVSLPAPGPVNRSSTPDTSPSLRIISMFGVCVLAPSLL